MQEEKIGLQKKCAWKNLCEGHHLFSWTPSFSCNFLSFFFCLLQFYVKKNILLPEMVGDGAPCSPQCLYQCLRVCKRKFYHTGTGSSALGLKLKFQSVLRKNNYFPSKGLIELTPWTQDVNWTYIRRSEDVLDVCWTSYIRSIYVLCLRDKMQLFH